MIYKKIIIHIDGPPGAGKSQIITELEKVLIELGKSFASFDPGATVEHITSVLANPEIDVVIIESQLPFFRQEG